MLHCPLFHGGALGVSVLNPLLSASSMILSLDRARAARHLYAGFQEQVYCCTEPEDPIRFMDPSSNLWHLASVRGAVGRNRTHSERFFHPIKGGLSFSCKALSCSRISRSPRGREAICAHLQKRRSDVLAIRTSIRDHTQALNGVNAEQDVPVAALDYPVLSGGS